MKFHYPLIALLAAACAGDAADKASGDTGDGTGDCTQFTYDGPVNIDKVFASCDGGGENIEYRIDANGITADGVVWAIESGNSQPWDEEQPISSFEFDACGSWDHLKVNLAAGEYGDFDPGSASGFNCDKINNPATMTFAFAIYDQGSNVVDCVVAGEDPSGVIAGDYGPDYFGTGPSFDLGACSQGTLAN